MADQPTPKTITATEASNRFGTMIEEASHGRSLFIITRMGKAQAVVIGVDQYRQLVEELESAEEQKDPEFQAALAQAREDVELGRVISLEELDQKFNLKGDPLNAGSE